MLIFLEYSIDMFLLLVSEFRFSCNVILGILQVCTLYFCFTKYCAVIYELFFIFHSLFYVLGYLYLKNVDQFTAILVYCLPMSFNIFYHFGDINLTEK